MSIPKTAQERAKAELAKKIKDGRKKDPYFMMSPDEKAAAMAKASRSFDRFLFKAAREVGMLDGYTGPDRVDDGQGGVNQDLIRHLNKGLK